MTDGLAEDEDKTLQDGCINACHCAGLLHNRLYPVLAGASAATKAYAFKGRLKPWWAVRDKILRKRNGGAADYDTHRVKDISGFRIITLFNADIPHRLDLLLSLFDASHDLFRNGLAAVEEIEIHSNRRPDDPQAITERVNAVVARWRERGPLPEPKLSGSFSAYSSVHVVLQFPRSPEIPLPTRCELQIRSVFEEAWSEISHKLGYGPEKLAASKAADQGRKAAPALWKQHLDALKSLADGCAHYSDLIAQAAGWNPGEDTVPPPSPKSIPDEGGGLEFYRDLPSTVIEQLKAAFRVRDRAEELRNPEGRSLPEAAILFKEAGAELERILIFLAERPSIIGSGRSAEILNGVRAECAYCLMHAQEPELGGKAERLWQEVMRVDPQFVPSYQRLGTLLMRKAEYEEAGQLLETGERLAVQQLQKGDDKALRQRLLRIRRDLGINYWRLAERADDEIAKSELLGKAIDASLAAVEGSSDEREIRVLSANAIYCLAELRGLRGISTPVRDQEAMTTLTRLRGAKTYGKWTRDSGWSDFALDSVMRGEAAFGDLETARAAARELLKRLHEKVDQAEKRGVAAGHALGSLNPDDQDIFRVASRILATAGG